MPIPSPRPLSTAKSTLSKGLGLFLVSCGVRTLTLLLSLVMAGYFGTSVSMDHYSAFYLVLCFLCVLSTAPLPMLVASEVAARGAGPGQARVAERNCRRWGRGIQLWAGAIYVLLAPVFAFLLVPAGRAEGVGDLLLLFFLGLPCMLAAPLSVLEQSLLQSKGQPIRALACSGIQFVTALLLGLLTGQVGGVYGVALSLALGAWLEVGVLRRLNRGAGPLVAKTQVVADSQVARPAPFPLAFTLTAIGATAGGLTVGLYDQWLLAAMGPGAQSTWTLATRLPSFIGLSLFGAVGVLCTTTLGHAYASGTLRRDASRLGAGTLVVGVALMGALTCFAHPLIQFLFERGAFTATDTERVASLTREVAWAYLIYPVAGIFIRAVSLQGGYRTLMLSSAMLLLVKVLAVQVLLPQWGVSALVASTLVASVVQLAILWRGSVSPRSGAKPGAA